MIFNHRSGNKIAKWHRITFSSRSTSALTTQQVLSKTNIPKSPWKKQSDPKGSGLAYYWNVETNETTALGAIKPQHWVEVSDPNGTSTTYWWNPETDETTALGERRPNSTANRGSITIGGHPHQIKPFIGNDSLDLYRQQQQHQLPPPTFAKSMLIYATFGAGMTFAIVAVRAILGF